MEQAISARFKQILESMVADLEEPLRRREEIAIESSPDAMDEVQNATEREFAIWQLEHRSGRFREVKAALQRISDGSYGACLHCESDISMKRLEAIPWTPYCLACQSIADQKALEEPDFVQMTGQGPKIMRAGQNSTAPGELPESQPSVPPSGNGRPARSKSQQAPSPSPRHRVSAG